MTKNQYIKNYMKFWEEIVLKVYLKSEKQILKYKTDAEIEAGHCYEETSWTPLDAVVSHLSPFYAGNRVIRGQKPREERWKLWIKYRLNKLSPYAKEKELERMNPEEPDPILEKARLLLRQINPKYEDLKAMNFSLNSSFDENNKFLKRWNDWFKTKETTYAN